MNCTACSHCSRVSSGKRARRLGPGRGRIRRDRRWPAASARSSDGRNCSRRRRSSRAWRAVMRRGSRRSLNPAEEGGQLSWQSGSRSNFQSGQYFFRTTLPSCSVNGQSQHCSTCGLDRDGKPFALGQEARSEQENDHVVETRDAKSPSLPVLSCLSVSPKRISGKVTGEKSMKRALSIRAINTAPRHNENRE